MKTNYFKIQMPLLIFIFYGAVLQATEIKVAVASNFQGPAVQIKNIFEAETSHKVNLISGSSGKHFAQIINGAPFDVFLAADLNYISKLEGLHRILPETKWQYAKGKLVLVVRINKPADGLVIKKLFSDKKLFTQTEFKKLQFTHLAMANPDLAPYGRAAKEILEKLELYQDWKAKFVVGENIQQTQQFIATGNAEIALLSLAQVISTQELFFRVPEDLYSPIIQEAVVLNQDVLNQDVLNAKEKIKAAKAFVEFLKTAKAKKIIKKFGYDTL